MTSPGKLKVVLVLFWRLKEDFLEKVCTVLGFEG